MTLRSGVVALLVAMSVLAGSCGGAGPSGGLRGTLNGSGATFPKLFYQSAIQVYALQQPALTVNYNPTGSGAGQTDLQNGLVDFAGTDSIVKDSDIPKFTRGPLLYFPTVAAPITVAYKLSGVTTLRLTPETLARIFGRSITSWADPAIAADNPSVKLPNVPILVVHRSDGSGTTDNFTRYLGKAALGTWTLGSGKTVAWPSETAAGEGNGGVAKIIQGQNGTIGYVDFGDAIAAKLATAQIRNRSGRFVAPSVEGASAALSGAAVRPNLTYDPLDAAGPSVYPITAPTWIITYARQSDAATRASLRGFLTLLLTTAQEGAASVHFARLPDELAGQAIAQLDRLEV